MWHPRGRGRTPCPPPAFQPPAARPPDRTPLPPPALRPPTLSIPPPSLCSPWVVNFGVNATLSGTAAGSDAARNRIAGVTSWGYTSDANKIQGVSWFGQNAEFPNSAYGTRGAGNIGKLVYDACDNPAGWGLQAKGYCL